MPQNVDRREWSILIIFLSYYVPQFFFANSNRMNFCICLYKLCWFLLISISFPSQGDSFAVTKASNTFIRKWKVLHLDDNSIRIFLTCKNLQWIFLLHQSWFILDCKWFSIPRNFAGIVFSHFFLVFFTVIWSS